MLSAPPLSAAEVLLDRLGDLRHSPDAEPAAGLDRRVDVKYAVHARALDEVLRSLARDHDLLAFDGTQLARCERVYFDTPQLRSFQDHVDGVRPRFKVRLARNLDTGESALELKLKLPDGSTARLREPYAETLASDLVADAARFAAAALRDSGLPAPSDLAPTLFTRFSRARLVARNGNAGVTVDVGVELEAADGDAVRLRPDHALVETKSRHGASPADHAIGDRQITETSLSKYRTGIDALVRRGDGGLPAAQALFGPV